MVTNELFRAANYVFDMLLAIDIGNTHVVVGLFDEEELVSSWRLQSNSERTVDEYALELLGLLQAARVGAERISGVIVSCVVPNLTRVFSKLSVKYFATEALIVSPGIRTGLKLAVDDPRSIGADRIVNAVAAMDIVGAPVVIVDFGTATTFDVISRNGVYEGGAIAPGVVLSQTALSERAAQLPFIELSHPVSVIGKNTKDAMLSGIYYGYLSLVEGLLKRIAQDLGETPRIIATGGLGRMFSDDIDLIEAYIPDLTLRGLLELWKKTHSCN